jgi:four helix bundle protein
MNDFYYRKLDAYQLAKTLALEIYKLVNTFPERERYGMCDQLRRAAISIPSNIAEGTGRFSIKERIHFLNISYGSLCETMCQMEIAKDLGYISQEAYSETEDLASRVSMTISGLKKSLSNKLNTFNPE